MILKILVTIIMALILYTDIKRKIIPDKLNLLLLLIILVGKFLKIDAFNTTTVFESILGFLIGGGFFFLLYYFTGAMGGGDVKLMAVLGIMVGPIDIMLITFLSFISGSVISVMLLLFKIKGKKDEIPFGPFIIISFFVTYFWSEEIISFYLNLVT